MEHVECRGARIPRIGLGTWRTAGRECYEAVSTALELGYRHVDTAQAYDNEREVGRALADSSVDRDEVFLTTKVDVRNARYDDVVTSTRGSLDRLGTDYVDLLLLHWPNPLVDIEETMTAMGHLRRDGAVRHVGVSNFSAARLTDAREASPVPLLADQVQFHPYRPQRDLLRYCQDHDVVLVAYSPLAHGGVLDDEALARVARSYDKTPAQVALRWAIQHRNVVAIPKSTNRAHLAENLAVFDFSLSRSEVERLARPSLLRTGAAWLRGRVGE